MTTESLDMSEVSYLFNLGPRGTNEDTTASTFPHIQIVGVCDISDADADADVAEMQMRALFELQAYILNAADCARERLNIIEAADIDSATHFWATRFFSAPGVMAGGLLRGEVKDALDLEDIKPSSVHSPTVFAIDRLRHVDGLGAHVIIRGLQRALSMFRGEYVAADNEDATFDWDEWGFVGMPINYEPDYDDESTDPDPDEEQPRIWICKTTKLMSHSRGVRWSAPGVISIECAKLAPTYDSRGDADEGFFLSVKWPKEPEQKDTVASEGDDGGQAN